MSLNKLINLIFIVLGLSGSLYVLYSVLIRTIRREIHNLEVSLNFLEENDFKINRDNHEWTLINTNKK